MVLLIKQFWKVVRDYLPARFVVRKRLPICPSHLHALVSKFAGPDALLPDIRDVCFCLIGFAGFLRFNELCSIRWCDISFEDTYFPLFIPRSKCDQYGSGSTRVIAKTGNPTCPFNMLRRYDQLSGDSLQSTDFLFRAVTRLGMGNIFFELALNFLTLDLKKSLFKNFRPLDWILSSMED